MNLETFGIKRYEAILKNGARVVFFKKPNSPLYINTLVKAGSCYDPAGKEGLSHFLEHMLSNGSKEFPTKDLLAEHIESIGGMYGLATNTELMSIKTEIAEAQDIDYAIDILKSVLVNPSLDKNKFNTEKETILAEYGKALSNNQRFIQEEILKNVFKNSSFDHLAIGNSDSINNINYEDVVSQYKNNITSINTTFVVCGDIDFDKLVTKLQSLELSVSTQKVVDTEHHITLSNPLTAHIKTDSKQIFLYYGFKGVDTFSKDAICLRVLGMIMAGGRTSRLTKSLRYEKGLVYSVSASRVGNLKESVWGILTDTLPNNFNDVIDVLKKEFEKLNKEGITDKELSFTKSKLVKSQKRLMQTSENWANFHSYGEALAKDEYQKFDDFIKIVESISTQDMNLVIEKYLKTDSAYLISIGNK